MSPPDFGKAPNVAPSPCRTQPNFLTPHPSCRLSAGTRIVIHVFENGDVNGDVVEQLQRAARLVSVAQGGLMAAIVAVARESPESEFVSMEISAALAWTRQRA